MNDAARSEIEAAKRAARAAALTLRDAAKAASVGSARQAAGHMLEEISTRQRVRSVAGYLPIGSELDTRPLMLALHGLRRRLSLPVVVEGEAQPLRFRRWKPGAPLEKGRQGVQVPVEGDWCEPELIVVPLLAFDAAGRRLGWGGGYYDRTLAARRAAGPVVAIGFALAAQQIAEVPHDAHDMHLDAVVTEAGVMHPA